MRSMRSHNKKRELRLTVGSLSQVEKLSFSFFGCFNFNILCDTFQDSIKDKKEIHTVNNNVYFVPFIVTNRLKYA